VGLVAKPPAAGDKRTCRPIYKAVGLRLCVCMYVCMFAYNSGTGGAIVSRFVRVAVGCSGDICRRKN